MNPTISFTIVAACVLTGFSSADAAVISVNFRENNGNANQTIAPATAAGGGAGVSVTNWNNVAGVPGGPAGSLTNDAGSATSAAVTWSSGGMWGDGTANTDATNGVGNAQLMRGYLDDNQGAPLLPITISLTGIPYAAYDLVVYFSTDTAGGVYGTITATDAVGAKTGATTGTKAVWSGNSAIDNTNSLRITGLTGNLSILAPVRVGDTRHSIAGLQIVEVPEPASLTFCGLAGLALMSRRRR